MGRHDHPPNRGGLKSRLDKTKKENMKLRSLSNRQRRNVKHLVSLIQQARVAIRDGNVLRTAALLEANIKYPPSAAVDCHHDWDYVSVRRCSICKEEWD